MEGTDRESASCWQLDHVWDSGEGNRTRMTSLQDRWCYLAVTSKNRSAPPDGWRLGPDWRTRIPQRLAQLAAAWTDKTAWTGMTRAGGHDMPAEVAGTVAIGEVVVHGWDIAAATGRDCTCDPGLPQAAYEFLQHTVTRTQRQPRAVRPTGTGARQRAATRQTHRADWPRPRLAPSQRDKPEQNRNIRPNPGPWRVG